MHATQQAFRTNRGWTLCLCLVALIAAGTLCTPSHAQTLIGSPGNGWQTWNLAHKDDADFVDLNNNNTPFWDVPLYAFGSYSGSFANKNVGWCLTSTGDCQGVGSATVAPGAIPFWGGPYDTINDIPSPQDTPGTGSASSGAIDPKVYFRSNSGVTYQATLFLNTATNFVELNEFGWFETDSTGASKGTRHPLFQGGGNPPGTNTPSPVGAVVNFTPTRYFGFYYQDISDPQTDPPYEGCLTFTILAFNDSDCTNTGQGAHNFAIFQQQVPNRAPVYWVAGQDPSACAHDGDCNLTIVKVRRLPLSD